MEIYENEDGTITKVTTEILPRYKGHISCANWYCDEVISEIKDECKIWTPCREYSSLSNTDFEPTGILEKDLSKFESEMGDEYECYVLGAYVHSSTSFSISKSGDHRCRFDSGQLGFIAIPKKCSWSSNQISDMLTSAWNGEYLEFSIIDQLTDDWNVDDCIGVWYDDYVMDYVKRCKTEYGVDFTEIEVCY